MQDPYTILGVSRNASQAEVKQSYRRLAKELHPDRQPGDSAATDRFKEISAAYHVLGDSRQRHKFDRGEIDGHGNDRTPFKRPDAKSKSTKHRPGGRNAKTAGASAPGTSAQGGFQASSSAQSGRQQHAGKWTQSGAGAGSEIKKPKATFENFWLWQFFGRRSLSTLPEKQTLIRRD